MTKQCGASLVGLVACLACACGTKEPAPPETVSTAVIYGSECWLPGQFVNWECCVGHPSSCESCVGDPPVCEPDMYCPMQPTLPQVDACCGMPGNEWQCNFGGAATACYCNCDSVSCPKGMQGQALKGGCPGPCHEQACACRCVDAQGTPEQNPPAMGRDGKCVGLQ